jgi:D-xylose transport system permease protein
MTDTVDGPVATGESPEGQPAGALDPDDLVALSPDVADSLGDYLRAWWKRIRGGESGALPIIIGLIVICIFFEVQSSAFLTAGNIVNLFVQAAFIVLLGMAELYALILSEIDLSVGFVGAVGAAIALALMGAPQNWPWWAALIVGMGACAVIGAFQGTIITRLRIPSFVVTLAGLLGWQGVLIYVFDVDKGAVGGVISISNGVIDDLVSGSMTPAAAWILLVVSVGLFALITLLRSSRRRVQGLAAPPLGISLLMLGAVAAAGVVLVWVCNLNRGVITPVQGVPWVIPVIIVILIAQSFLLARTRLGRYIYAIGLAAVAYASRLGSISVGFDGGTYVLYAVAAAVIGGASLFGGYGKPIHPLLGGLVIATLTNGLALLNITTAGTDIATAAVLIVAVAVDATLRRRGRTA